MTQDDDLRLKLPARLGIDARVAQNHALSYLVFVNVAFARFNTKTSSRPVLDVLDGNAFVLNALHQHGRERAVTVRTEQKRRVRPDFAAHDQSADDGADSLHGERIIEVHERLVSFQRLEHFPRWNVIQKHANESQSLSRHARRLKNRRDHAAGDVLDRRHDILFVTHENGRLVHARTFEHF